MPSDKTMPSLCSVSVVIPTKNAGSLFEEVLAALVAQQGVVLDLVVVDSGSCDGTLDIAKKYGARITEIPPHIFNHGSTRDQGIALAKQDVVVLMTQDATPESPYLLQHLVAAFDDPKVGGAYARQIPRPDADVLTKRNLGLAMTGRLVSEVRSLPNLAAWQNMQPYERFALCNFDNVCSALRKQAWESIHFGEVAFAEDIEWSRKALEAGWHLAYVAEACVIHSHDRPLRYDFQRTYLTHRKLYEQYQFSTVPTLLRALGGIYYTFRADWHHIRCTEPSRKRKLKWLCVLPFLTIACVMGQYIGARDERRGKGKDIAGI